MDLTQVLIAILVPVFTEVVKRWQGLEGGRAFALAAAMSAAGGVAVLFLGGGLAGLPALSNASFWTELGKAAAAILGTAQVIYWTLLKKLPETQA